MNNLAFRSDPQYRSAVVEEAKKRLEIKKYYKYQKDPVSFCKEVLGLDILTDDMADVIQSVVDNPVTVVESANGVGKSQPITTSVLTPEGFTALRNIEVGDFVYGKEGKPIEVLGVYPQGLQPTYKITFNDDSYTHCSEDHLWAVRSSQGKGRGKDYQVKTTKELIDILHRHIHIPLCDPVEFEGMTWPWIDPYVMGVLLGDGTMSISDGVRFDTADRFILDQMEKRIRHRDVTIKWYRKTHFGITSPPGKPNIFLEYCQDLGITNCRSYEKFIPDPYFFGSIEQRKLLLMGLMDTDGTINKTHSMLYTTTSRKLAIQVQWIVQSLGGTARIKERYTHFTYKGVKKRGRLSYRLLIKLDFCPFLLPRKRARYKPQDKMQKQAHRLIDSIEYVGERESVCIQVDSPDGLYLTERFIVTHNTHVAAHVAAWFYKCHDGAQIYTTAAPPLDNLKKLLWGEIGKIQRLNRDIFKNDRSRELIISRPLNDVQPNEFITGVSIPSTGSPEERESKFSGKHSPFLLFIIDEGDAVPEEVYRGIDSCMSGGFARLLVMYNPRSDGGPVAKLKSEGANVIIADAFHHPNVVTGQDIIPGAVTQEKTINRIFNWTRPFDEAQQLGFTGFGSFEVPEHLIGVVALNEKTREPLPPVPAGKRMVIDDRFSYMVLAQYPGISKGVIYDTWRDMWSKEYVNADLMALAENGTWEQCQDVDWPEVPGNVSARYDYEPGAGTVLWSIDDGYEGKVDNGGMFTAESHPRTIGLYQHKPNGDMVLFDECYMILEPNYDNQIQNVLDRGYERPEFVVLGPGSKSLGGWLANAGFYKKTWAGRVEDSIKEARKWISPDENNHRRFLAHPRCKHTRFEYPRYKKDANGRIKKEFDHGPDRDRYLLWMFRNMEN